VSFSDVDARYKLAFYCLLCYCADSDRGTERDVRDILAVSSV